MAWSRTSRHLRGYGTAWDKIRLAVMRRDRNLCQSCLKQGLTEVATDVDHVRPKAKGGTDDMDNLQALCRPCHKAKTADEEHRGNRVRIGADGWPLTD